MIMLFHCFYLRGKCISPWLMFSSALLGVAIVDSLALYQPGLWLSFMAVLTLLWCFAGKISPREQEVKGKATAFLSAQWALFIGLCVVSVLWAGGVSVISPLTNAIAVPVVSFVVVPLLFLSVFMLWLVPSLGVLLLHWVDSITLYLWRLLTELSHFLPGFWVFSRGEITVFSLLLAMIGTLWLLMPRGVPVRWLGCCYVPLLFPTADTVPLRVTFLDVGQGTAVVIETQHHQMVYDTGREFSANFNSGEHIIAPYLRQQGYPHIDKLMISHADSDHAGGAEGLLRSIAVANFMVGEKKGALWSSSTVFVWRKVGMGWCPFFHSLANKRFHLGWQSP